MISKEAKEKICDEQEKKFVSMAIKDQLVKLKSAKSYSDIAFHVWEEQLKGQLRKLKR